MQKSIRIFGKEMRDRGKGRKCDEEYEKDG